MKLPMGLWIIMSNQAMISGNTWLLRIFEAKCHLVSLYWREAENLTYLKLNNS